MEYLIDPKVPADLQVAVLAMLDSIGDAFADTPEARKVIASVGQLEDARPGLWFKFPAIMPDGSDFERGVSYDMSPTLVGDLMVRWYQLDRGMFDYAIPDDEDPR